MNGFFEDMRQTLSNAKRIYLQSRVVADQRKKVNYAFIHINKCGGTSLTQAINQKVKLHDTAQQRREKLGFQRWGEIYTFSVVRHPYERIVSMYSFTKKTAYAQVRLENLDLNSWVAAVLRDQTIPGLNSQRMAPCKSWLCDESGIILVDDVFKLESLQNEWPVLKRKLKISSDLPHVNESKGSLSRFDLNAESLRIIQSHFADDFEAFGYEA